MRVLYYHQHFTTPKVGGATRSYEFAQRLIARGHQVTMVCGGNHDFKLKPIDMKYVTRGELDGIDLIQIKVPYGNKMGLVERAKSFGQYAIVGKKLLKKLDYDLVFCTSTPLTAGMPGYYAKNKYKKPFVFEVRDLWPDLPKALGMKNPVFISIMKYLEKKSYYRANGCIGLSPGICEGIKSRSQTGKPIEMIPNGCDLDVFKPDDRANLKLEGIKSSDTVAIFTGAHGIANGLDSILNAAGILKQRGRNDIVFAFIGDGREKPRLVERAKNEGLDNCRFYNPVPKTQLKDIVCSADIGLMCLKNVSAFYYGTSPNKFFDYIASGLPVLNNYPGWLADMIKENECGIAVEPDNAEAYADAMEYLADHPEVRKTMGKNARKLAERDFNRDDLADKFTVFLEKMYKEHNS